MTTTKTTKATAWLVLIFLFSPMIAVASSALWGDLQPGPNAVGFRTIEQYDRSRTYRPKNDYFGEPVPGDRARPIQVCLWYPAQAEADAASMVLSEYVFPSPDDYDFFNYISEIQRRELGFIGRTLGLDRNQLLDVISVEVAAVRDASPAAGTFPVIVYHPDLPGGVVESALLCEFLASHGYVVVTTHNVGGTTLEVAPNIYDIETLIRDKEMALSYVHDLEFVNPDALGLLGLGFGGLTAAAMQARNYDVDFVATIDDWCLKPERLDELGAASLLNARRMSVPVVRFYRANDTTIDLSAINEWKFSNRYLQPVTDIPEGGFTIFPALGTIMEGGLESTPEITHPAFDAMCERLLLFFKARLTHDVEATDALLSLLNGGSDLTLMPGEDLPPTQNQFMAIIRSQGAVRAEEIFNQFTAIDPGSLTIDEPAFNMFGYQALQRRQTEDALILFRMNADAHPTSANCWDSYADGMQAASDTAGTIMCYRKVLEVLPRDTVLDSATKVILLNNAEQGLARLAP